jgi:hypothetical protein
LRNLEKPKMLERQPSPIDVLDTLDAGAPIPAARSLDQFCIEQVGDDVVLYDIERIQYHSLNSFAYSVWRLCDGQRTTAAICSLLADSIPEVRPEAVSLAIAEIGEAGLLDEPAERFDARIQRRTVLKLAAAGVIGAVGLPLVQSITAPSAEAQATTCGTQNNNTACTSSTQCKSCCCCQGGGPGGGSDCANNCGNICLP